MVPPFGFDALSRMREILVCSYLFVQVLFLHSPVFRLLFYSVVPVRRLRMPCAASIVDDGYRVVSIRHR